MSNRSYCLLVMLLACAPLSAARAGTAARPTLTCKVAGKPIARASSACEHGLPAVIGRILLVPRACRIPMDGSAVDRHSIEIRDAKTGAKRGQTSLPARPADPKSPPPRVGALIAGAYPLYVFSGGIAAVDPGQRKAELVLESSTKLLAATRHGEVLGVVDTAAPSKTFPKGAVEWTVVDFGSSEMLGQVTVAGAGVDGLGFTASGAALEAWLLRKADGKAIELHAAARDAKGKPVSKDGRLRAKLRPAGKASAVALPLSGAGVPTFSSTEAIVTANPPVRIAGKTTEVTLTQASRRSKWTGPQPPIAIVGTRPGAPFYGWFPTPSGARLRRVECTEAAAPPAAKAPVSKKR